MINKKRVLAVIPARSGSKGIKFKNIKRLSDIPLICWVNKAIKKINFIDRTIVSTDHNKIKQIAINCNLDVPFMRPKNLSGDRVSDLSVLNHALDKMEKIDSTIYDIILLLQPTSPFRKPKHVIGCVKMLINKNLDSVWTVSKSDLKMHPLKQLKVSKKLLLNYYDSKGEKIIARQQLKTLYHRNGACYAFTRNCLKKQKRVLGLRCGALITEDLINIDTQEDFQFAEFLSKKRNKN